MDTPSPQNDAGKKKHHKPFQQCPMPVSLDAVNHVLLITSVDRWNQIQWFHISRVSSTASITGCWWDANYFSVWSNSLKFKYVSTFAHDYQIKMWLHGFEKITASSLCRYSCPTESARDTWWAHLSKLLVHHICGSLMAKLYLSKLVVTVFHW